MQYHDPKKEFLLLTDASQKTLAGLIFQTQRLQKAQEEALAMSPLTELEKLTLESVLFLSRIHLKRRNIQSYILVNKTQRSFLGPHITYAHVY